jgi:Mce-associated membrane protein
VRGTSDAQARPLTGHSDEDTAEDTVQEIAVEEPTPATEHPVPASGSSRRGRLSVPLVPVLAVLFVLLLAAAAFLWFTRPQTSSIRTGDYAEVLQAARSEVVDLTSFDYLTLDDDIEQAKRITTGDLRDESVQQLDDNRQQLTDSQAVVSTEIVGAGVTRADDEHGTVLLVIQATQRTSADEQAQVVRYRIQAELTKVDGRWLLSGIAGR